MFRKRMMIIIFCILFCLTNVYAETHHEYNGSDRSKDGIQLNYFSVEGTNELIAGSQLYVNFTLQNVNDAEIQIFEADLATKRPNGTIIHTPITMEETFNPLEKIIVNTTIKLNETGSWSLWPSYEFYTSSVTTAPKKITGPDYWQSYNVSIEGGKADLIISEVNCDWENKKIAVVIENIGQVDVTKDYGLALFVNDEKKLEETISSSVPAKKQITEYLDAINILYGNSVDITIQVDSFNEIEEKNEENNQYQIYCAPSRDNTPPVFITEPSVV
ncbi:MAG: CARDB domain-containing protein, partial [Thermoplasmatota archaeon]